MPEDKCISASDSWSSDAQTPLRPKPVYTAADHVLAWLCWLLGFLFWRLVMPAHSGAGVVVFAAAFTGVQLWFRRCGGVSAHRCAWVMLLPLLFSVPFVLYSESPTGLSLLFLILLGAMSVFYTYVPPRFDVSDLLRGLFTRPFGWFLSGVAALTFRPAKTKSGKSHSHVVLGLVLAVPLTLLIGLLLTQADALFAEATQTLFRPFEQLGDEVWLLIPRLVVGIPVGLYLFGALYGSAHHTKEGVLDDESWKKLRQGARQLPSVTLLIAGIPICVLYALFLITQSAYFFSAFADYLPAGFTAADYARRGFFELCAVAVINLAVLLAVRMFCQRDGEHLPRPLRVYSTVLCSFTLLLIATALSKMGIYIGRFGLTPLRVCTSWFMLLLAAVFLILAIAQYFHRLHAGRAVAAVTLGMVALLQFSNVNGLIARYNVEQYRAGTLPELDVSLFYELGDAAVPYAAALLDDADKAPAAQDFLLAREEDWSESSWINFNFQNRRARETIASLHESGHPPLDKSDRVW